MSVIIEKNVGLKIKTEVVQTGEEYVERMKALISILQMQEEPIPEQWHVLQMVREMLPSPEQAAKMFNVPH